MKQVYDFSVQKQIFDAVVQSDTASCKMVSDQFGIWSCKGLSRGCTNHVIQGSNPYLKSEGNNLCTAARHSGLIDPLKGGLFRRYDIGKVAELNATEANGIQTQSAVNAEAYFLSKIWTNATANGVIRGPGLSTDRNVVITYWMTNRLRSEWWLKWTLNKVELTKHSLSNSVNWSK